MKYAIIPIMALLLMGGVYALADNQQDVICIDCDDEPQQEEEQVVVMVDEPRRKSDRVIDECDFDRERPRCVMHVWDDDKTMIVDGVEIPIEYDYRNAKDKLMIGVATYDLEKSGAFHKGEFMVNGRTFEFMKGSSWRTVVREI